MRTKQSITFAARRALREASVTRHILAAIGALTMLAAAATRPHAEPVQGPGSGVPAAETQDGATLYDQHCAECHEFPTGRIPARSFISMLRTPESIITTLTKGPMRQVAKDMTPGQVHDIAVYLTGREPGNDPQPDLHANMCKDDGGPIDLGAPGWNGWGNTAENTRYQPNPGVKTEDVPKLKVKWAFAYPGIAYGQPVVVSGRVFIETREGQVFSLDAQTGCTHWVNDVGTAVRTAISVGPAKVAGKSRFAVYFGDEKAVVHALDAMTGEPIWSTQIEKHPLARITGAPKLYAGRLYVPVSSMEEVSGATPKYQCCTFQGSVAALDANTGKVQWQTYMLPQKPKKTRKNAAGVQMFGPAGVAIWDSPTIDAKRKLLYIGTGDSYTDEKVDSSDAIVALDLKTGARKWVTQVRKEDNWLVGCPEQTQGNCPKPTGPDFDFGSSPILHTLPDGKQIILAGAKSSIAYGFDPDAKGKQLWERKLGAGSSTGGIEWGPAVDGDNYYVSVGDAIVQPPNEPGGVWALNPKTGEIVWHTPAPQPVCSWGTVNCSKAQPSAVTAIPGAVFVGSWDGHIRAYAPMDGKIFWDFDTAQTYDAVNGIKAKGGAIDMGGQVLANGMLLVNSGVTPIQRPGNALLAFTVDGK
jgi:polyvinyl alcohol dehydrogenase (cytochrome)